MPALFAVTPNPALDITLTLPSLQPGASHRVPAAVRRLGGKGINVAAVAAEQGIESVALGPVSAASFAEFEAHCDYGSGVRLPENLRQAFTDTPTPLRSTIAIHQTDDSSTSIVNEAGSSHPTEVFSTILDRLADELGKSSGNSVSLSGSFPPEAPGGLIPRLTDICRSSGSPLVVDTYGDPLLQACDHGATVVTPNADELRTTTGYTDVSAGAQELLRRGAELVVVTLGSEGIFAATRDAASGIHVSLTEPLSGNPTGAGDALTAALASALLGGHELTESSLPEVLSRAVCWSAAAVLSPAAGSIGTDWPQLLPCVRIR